jgi:hypothetical protein
MQDILLDTKLYLLREIRDNLNVSASLVPFTAVSFTIVVPWQIVLGVVLLH